MGYYFTHKKKRVGKNISHYFKIMSKCEHAAFLSSSWATFVRKCTRLEISSPLCRGLTDVPVTKVFLLAITPPAVDPA